MTAPLPRLDGLSTEVPPALAAHFRANGWWDAETIAERIDALAKARPDDAAFIMADSRFSWADYARSSDRIAWALAGLGFSRGDRVAVVLPDGPTVHAAFVGLEKAGLVIVGIGARAGDAEIAHLIRRTGARALVTHGQQRDRTAADMRAALAERDAPLEHLVELPDFAHDIEAPILIDGAAVATEPRATTPFGPNELFMINSTSGTTGLPKCVMHTQNRWVYFHKLAAAAGRFGDDEIFMGAVPAPFGFGLWTAHFSPVLLGAPTVLLPKFDAGAALDLIEREKVTVLCCVSTQFIMMLNEQAERPRDFSSLRSMFTGGEAVPYERAAEFERVTGAAVLQFYGSNETGALSCTTAEDSREHRLRTAGRIIPDMEVRLFDVETGADVTGERSTGQPGCRGPATCLGYWDDAAANAKLFTRDGYMLMGDIVSIDADGYLSVIGRTSDFIIRGGKNISAPAVEEEVASHPSVALCAAVPAPDPVFGERVCIYAELRPGQSLELADLTAHLKTRGISREWYPEHLIVVDALPRSSGGKVAKGDLREDAKARFGAAR
jgi:acyl-CoA synthetase